MRQLLLALLIAAVPAFGQFSTHVTATYDHSKVGAGSEDEAAFPTLLYLYDPSGSSFKTIANGGKVRSSVGADILVYAEASCATQLPSQIDTYNGTTGIATVWVKVSLSHSANGSVTVCYGNASPPARTAGVFDTNFTGVYHLGDGATVSLADSGLHANTLTESGSASAPGKVGGGLYAADSGTHSVYTGYWTNDNADLTYCAWFDHTASESGTSVIFQNWQAYLGTWTAYATPGTSGSWIFGFAATVHFTGSVALADNAWHYLCGVRSGTTITEIGDGAVVATGTGTLDSTGGSQVQIPYQFTGYVDEVRLSNIARSAGWISTEYQNMNAPGQVGTVGFWTFGAPTDIVALSVSGCTSGSLGAASSTCTVTLTGGTFDGTAVTLADADSNGNSNGGAFTSSLGNGVGTVTVAPSSGNTFTFTYTPVHVGALVWTVTNAGSWLNPSPVTYTVTSADACTFTAKATGNWNSAGTWTVSGCTGGGHTTPVSGDTVSITGYAVTCSTGTCRVGTSPANNTTYNLTIGTGGSLCVASGATLWLTGNYILNSATGANPGVLQIGTGATFSHDNNNSATVSYRGVGGANADWNNIKIGTTGDTCTTTSSYSYSCPTTYQGVNVSGGVYPVLFDENGLYDNITYQVYGATVKYCGTATKPCLDLASNNQANGYGSAGIIDVENSVFDHTSVLGNAGLYSGSAVNHLTWTGNREVNDLVGFMGVDVHNFLSHIGSCVITGNYFDAQVGPSQNDSFGGCAMTWNVFSNGLYAYSGATYPWTFTNNFHIFSSGAEPNQGLVFASIGNVLYQDGSVGSAHMGYNSVASDAKMVENIGDHNGMTAESHCYIGGGDHPTYKATILDNLSVMTYPSGNAACEWWADIQTSSTYMGQPAYIDHNGANGASGQAWMGINGHSGNYYSTGAVIQSMRANIGWAPSAGTTNYQITDLQGSGSTPATMVNASTVVDWNNNFNANSSPLFPSSTFYHTAYQINSNTASPGAHETAVDPKYIDTARRVDTWAARVMGQAQTINGARAAMWGCASIPSCIGNMYAWIRRGWQPTNMALKGLAHDGKIIGFNGTYGSGYSGTCGVTFTPQDAWDLGGSIPAMAAGATCTFVGGAPQITITNGGAHYRIATPATVAITCGGCTPTAPASLTPIIQPSDIGPVPMVLLPSAF